MNKKKRITWIAVMDGKHSNFYTMMTEHHLGDLHHTLSAKPIRTDEPTGRGELGRTYDSAGGARHIIEPHTSDRTLERKQFMREVAEYLKDKLDKEEYHRLIITAPPKILGFLRKELSKTVKDVIALEIDKDLVEFHPKEIQEYLEKIIHI
ncbi:host attachment protein [Rickettsiales bacterium]|nr:host attachment protein [Rickettsiales bacterium]